MKNETLSSEVDSLKSRIAVLEMQTKLSREAKAEEQGKAMETNKLKEQDEAEIAKLKGLIQKLESKTFGVQYSGFCSDLEAHVQRKRLA